MSASEVVGDGDDVKCGWRTVCGLAGYRREDIWPGLDPALGFAGVADLGVVVGAVDCGPAADTGYGPKDSAARNEERV